MDKLVSANTLKFDNKVDINREIILSETVEVSFRRNTWITHIIICLD